MNIQKTVSLFFLFCFVFACSALAAETPTKTDPAKTVEAKTDPAAAISMPMSATERARLAAANRAARHSYPPYSMMGMMPPGSRMMGAQSYQPVVTAFGDGSFVVLIGGRLFKYDNQLKLVKQAALPAETEAQQVS